VEEGDEGHGPSSPPGPACGHRHPARRVEVVRS
jgi:hypothetical protein